MPKHFLLILFAATLNAEYRQIDIQVKDLDCASCVSSLTGSLKKIRGVEKAEIGMADGSVRLLLAAENKVTLEQIRDKIKGAGFTPRDAKVVVRGKPLTDSGRWQFTIEGTNQTYLLTTSDNGLIAKLQGGGMVTVDGVCPAMENPREQPILDVKGVHE